MARCGIIGGTGWLGSALGRRLLEGGIIAAADLAIANRSGAKAGYHGHSVRWFSDASALAAACDVIIVVVRPEDWPALHLAAPDKLLISFMAGIGAEDLARSGARVVRAMPNAAAELGQSYSPFWAGDDVTAADRALVRRILGAIGTTDELGAEDQIDLMTALPGSGAAYPALMALAMADFMTRNGVPEDISWRAAEATIQGGAALFAGRPDRARVLIEAYIDYRGTTAAGLQAAEAGGFSQALAAALQAATNTARAMNAAKRH